MDVDRTRDEPLSPVDTACLRIEDRTCLIVNAGAMLFAEPLELETVKNVLEQRFLAFHRFSQRVVDSGLPLAPPHWEDDPLFDLRSHLHHTALPAPGDDRVLQEVLSDLVSTPLDRARPLWQVHLIENYGRGCVVLFRVHHSLADGMALVPVLRAITDRSPETSLATRRLEKKSAQRENRRNGKADRIGLSYQSVLSETEARLHQGITALFHPSASRDLAGAASDAAATLGKLLLLGHDTPTVFKGPLGVPKRVAWSAPVPVRELKEIAHALGASINEVLLCAVTGALRRDLQRRGDDVCDMTLRVSIPVNLPHQEAASGLENRFSLNILALPVDRGDPRERIEVLRHRLKDIKESSETEVMFGLMNLFGLLPSEIGNLLISLLNKSVTAILSSVPGPPRRVYFAGKPVDRMVFWVPQTGRLGLGLSILTYQGLAMFGVACDAGLVPDPHQIIQGFHAELEQLAKSCNSSRMNASLSSR